MKKTRINTPEETRKYLRPYEERRANTAILYRATIRKDEMLWAEKNQAACSGKVGRLTSKLNAGLIRPKAYQAIIKTLRQDPTKREDDDYKKIIDHLIKGDFVEFGENFPEILEAFESDDPEIKALADSFLLPKSGIKGERKFLKTLNELKKTRVSPEDLVKQTKGELTLANKTGDENQQKKRMLEIVKQGDLGILPKLPEAVKENLQKNVREFTKYLNASTKSIDELRETLRQSQEVVKAKEAVKTKAKNNPEFAKKLKETLLGDRELSRKVLQETGVKPEQIEEKIDQIAERMVELDFERTLEGPLFDAIDAKVEIKEADLNSAVTQVKKRYDLDTKVSDMEFLKMVKRKYEAHVSLERKHDGIRTEYLNMAADLKIWQEACAEAAEEVRTFEELSGIEMVDHKDGLGIHPKEVDLLYRGIESKRDEKTGEDIFEKDPKGHVRRQTQPSKILGIRFAPQPIEPENAEKWRGRERLYPGILKIKVEGFEKELNQRQFLEWARGYDVRENIKSLKELEARLSDDFGYDIEIKSGTVFIDAADVLDPPRYEVIEIANVGQNGVTLANDVNIHPAKAVSVASSIRDDEIKKDLDFGELYSLIKRRGLFEPKSRGTRRPNLRGKDYDEPTEIRQKGTLGDLFAENPEILAGAGAGLSSNALDAFKNHPLYVEEGRDAQGRHFEKQRASGGLKMHSAQKFEEAIRQAQEQQEHEEGQEPHTVKKKPKEKEEKADLGEEKRHWHKEALPMNELHTEGETHTESVSWLKKLWTNSRFLATDDVGGLLKSVYEHYQRRWQRKSKERFSVVGEGLPWGYGTEMSRVKQQAEDEEVHQNEEAMENWGINQVTEALHHAKNKDQLKACFKVLAKKGHIRWDDVETWESLNRYVPEGLKIPIPPHHNAMFKDPKTGKTGLDFIESAVDYIWGQSQYQEWMSENDNHYASKIKEYEEKGKRLEGDPKNNDSIVGELQTLLARHKKGEYVDPHEYEGLIHFMIKYGKGNMEAKVYYILEGVSVPNPVTGETILAMDRIGSINGQWLNQLPFMDYLTRRDVPRPGGGESPWTIYDFKKWCTEWDAAARPGKENLPNNKVVDFLWNHVLIDEKTIIRNNKGLRNAENMDHDDSHFIIPLTDEDLVTDVCASASGNKRYFTTEGFANAYVGYSQYSKTLATLGEKAKLINTLRSFTRFNGILSKRYRKDGNTFARLGDNFMKRPSNVDATPVGIHKREMEGLIVKISEAYVSQFGDSEDLMEAVRWMHADIESGPNSKEKQDKVQAALDNFGRRFQKTIEKDKGELLLQVVNGSGLKGMQDAIPLEQRAKVKEQIKEEMGESDELGQIFTDWKRD